MLLRRLAFALGLVALCGPSAWGFDFARYQMTDLDAVLAQRRPQSGADIYPARPLKLIVRLTEYGHPCNTAFLKRAMIATGADRQTIDRTAITQCIKVRTDKGREVSLFIQDIVASFLPKEVPVGSTLTLFAIHVFTESSGPGLLVNEFLVGNDPSIPEPQRDNTDAGGANRLAWARQDAGLQGG